MEEVSCPECGNNYEAIGIHWNSSPSHRPKLTQKQKEVITGLLMGDGSINRSSKTPFLEVNMTSKKYLEYVDDIFRILSTGVRYRISAKDMAENDRERDFNSDAKEKNYSDQYRLKTRSHPQLQQFAEWYSTGKKVWPEDINLTPTVLKHWYCGDGYWFNKNNQNSIRIAMSNEIGNENKIDEMFTNAGLPKPSAYSSSKREDGSKTFSASFTVEGSSTLFEYMGEPLPDFEYKWPTKYR
jgi:hypothetical protein